MEEKTQMTLDLTGWKAQGEALLSDKEQELKEVETKIGELVKSKETLTKELDEIRVALGMQPLSKNSGSSRKRLRPIILKILKGSPEKVTYTDLHAKVVEVVGEVPLDSVKTSAQRLSKKVDEITADVTGVVFKKSEQKHSPKAPGKQGKLGKPTYLFPLNPTYKEPYNKPCPKSFRRF